MSGADAMYPVRWARELARGENDLTWKGIAVARTIADHASGDRSALLQETIAAEARMSERAVRDGLSELRRLGVLESRRTRGASVFLLQSGTTCRTESGTTRRTEGQDRQDMPVRPAPHADRRTLSKENQEVSLSEGSNENAHASRSQEGRHSLEVIRGNGDGSTPVQLPILAAAKPLDPPAEVQQLAEHIHRILNGGFVGLTDPQPTWKRPTVYAVTQVLVKYDHLPILAEGAARHARRTMQAKEDGRNVVGLFESAFKRDLRELKNLHRQAVAEFGEAAAS